MDTSQQKPRPERNTVPIPYETIREVQLRWAAMQGQTEQPTITVIENAGEWK